MLKKLAALSVAALAMTMPAQAQDLTSLSWDQIVAQAKKEGQVTWFHWYFQDRFREQVKAFEAEYGIKVTIPDGDWKTNINKLLAEKGRAEGDIDVISTSGTDLKKISPETTYYGPINKLLPDTTKLRYEIEGVNSNGFAVAFWGNQSGIAYNPQVIKESELPRTIEQFSNFLKENPGEVGFNVENGGSGPAFIESVTRKLVPGIDYASGVSSPEILKKLDPAWKWFSERKDQFVITASNADSVTRLASGEFKIVAAWEDYVAGLQKKGEVPKDIKVYVPDFGMPGGGNVVGIPANAKHKAAALLFIHWLTSAKTQTKFTQDFGVTVQNADADSTASLIPQGERKTSLTWASKPLGDDIKNQFIQNVTLR
ncbi:extracellular solute-binding protein [Agrobacterium vitis]|uniref:extracellular solute-binding protein n=1 Tax=Allorhizobium ampelinum TaxID=3025782 RepID=UPI001F390CF3|nr:extracellular solute-binding protein [Allorhizobium ampelinum]MCF1450686.1 extracellular solute-binding protein [Allorhizobium ampelinum]